MHIFISYAKKDTRDLAFNLRDALIALPGVTVWMDESLEAGDSWATQIQHQIDRCDYVVVLLSPDVNRTGGRRSFVLNEIDYAQQENKPIIPIMAHRTRMPVQLAGIQYIDFTGDHAAGIQRLVRDIARRAGISIPKPPPPGVKTPASLPAVPPRHEMERGAGGGVNLRRPLIIAAVAVVLLSLLVLAYFALNQPSHPNTVSSIPSNTPPSTPPSVLTFDATNNAFFTQTATFSTSLPNSTLTPTLTTTPTIDPNTILATSLAETQISLNSMLTQVALEQTATVAPFATLYPLAFTGVSRNADWSPVYQAFNSVEMVLVPAGCFMMGSDVGEDDENPVHEQCFSEPFWLDRTEVTRAMYSICVSADSCTETLASTYSTRDNQPINRVNWFQAYDYCSWRDARLPTEAEWGYAARGPDNRVYPWGSGFLPNEVVYSVNFTGEVGDVGGRFGGMSWTGSLDLSGNLLEWVNSAYRSYPYDPYDGRETFTDDPEVLRVLRGGSLRDISSELRTANRDMNDALFGNTVFGFRCAADFVN